jgi:hypothetical protein
LKSDEPLTHADELLFRVLSVIASKLPTARVHREAVPLATARALAGRTGGLVYVDAMIDKGKLRVALDVYPPVPNAWERWKNPSPEPSSHQFVEVPIDAEIRSFLPPILLERAQVHRMRIDDDVAAMGCGDVDGDGGIDLVVVSDKRVAVGHAHANRFVVDKSVQITRIASRAPVPLREPIASVAFDRGGDARLWLGTTDVGGVALDASLARKSSSDGIPFATAHGVMCATPSPETSSFEGALVPCIRAGDADAGGGGAAGLAVPAQRFDAYASFDLIAKNGASPGSVAAAREPGGRLRLSKGDATAVLDGVGADVALFDLDQDGIVELVSSQEAGEDAISIVSWDGTTMRPRLRIPAAAGVRALTVCPPESHGAPFVVAAVGNEVWLVR